MTNEIDFLSLVFTKTPAEFSQYLKALDEKPHIEKVFLPADISGRQKEAIVHTKKGKRVYMYRVESLSEIKRIVQQTGMKLGEKQTEVIMTGSWFEAGWITNILQNLRDNYPGLSFRSAYIGTKPR